MRIRLEQRLEDAVALHERFEIRGEERALREGLPVHRPLRAEAEEHFVVPDARVGVGRFVELHVDVLHENGDVGVLEVDLARARVVLRLVAEVALAGDAVVFVLPLVDRLRCRDRRAALPLFRDPRVSGPREGASSEIGADEDRVLVFPSDRALRFGELEAAGNECLLVDVELANHLGVATAAREAQEALLLQRRQTVGAVEDVALGLLLTERVDVQDDRPIRLWLLVVGNRRLAPQAARVLGVRPEVANRIAHDARAGDPLLRAVDREEAGLECLEARVGRELLFGLLVVGARERQRTVARDLFEVEIGVVVLVGGRDGRRCVLARRDGGGGTAAGRECQRARHQKEWVGESTNHGGFVSLLPI